MSGQPNRKPQDADNFRDDYMNQLNLRAAVDDVNYQANKTYKATGALPPQSSMTDNRSTSEILADVARLKVELIAEFKPLLNPQSAALLIQRIEQSPLNGDGSLLVFLAQNAKQIIPKLQLRYAKGIKGDDNDVETLKAFIENLYSELKDSTGSIKSFFDRPQITGSRINAGDISALIQEYDNIRLKITSEASKSQTTNALGYQHFKLGALNLHINYIFDRLYDYLSAASYDAVKEQMYYAVRDISFTGLLTGDKARTYLDFIESLPNPSQLRALISQLSKAVVNKDDALSRQIMRNMLSILPSKEQLDKMRDIVAIAEHDMALRAAQNMGLPSPSTHTPSTTDIQLQQLPQPPTLTPSTTDIQLQQLPQPPTQSPATTGKLTQLALNCNIALYQLLDKALNVRTDNAEDEPNASDFGMSSDLELKKDITKTLGLYIQSQESADPDYRTNMNLSKDMQSQLYNLIIHTYKQIVSTKNNMEILAIAQNIRDNVEGNTQKLKPALQSMGINGTGVKRGRGRPRVQGSGIATPKKFLVDKVDHSAGIKPDKKYIPFGKYYIHRHKLNDNILSFRHPSGVSVIGQPAHRVSDKLGNVMRDIVGGKVPSFNDLSGLTEDEKSYLYKVSKRADIADKLSIPTPSKDAVEKDIHDFEVMKGEIMAGNDSVPLIKKFKLLLLRLSKSGTLPKADVQEIMEELLTLGY